MYDTGIIVFCNITKKVLKSNGKILILPFMRDPSTCDRERVKPSCPPFIEKKASISGLNEFIPFLSSKTYLRG